MIRKFFLILVLNSLFQLTGYGASFDSYIRAPASSIQDSLYLRQLLYNGRKWKSLYGSVRGHEFFLTNEWLPGEVKINKRTYSPVTLKYDVFNDQLLTMVNPGTIVILNREAVERFTIKSFSDFNFINYINEESSAPQGYCHLLRDGKTKLIVKYIKQIKILAVENKYDEFYSRQSLYLLKDNKYYRITSRKDLLKALEDHDDEIKKHLTANNLKFNIRNPDTIIPVLEFYDSLAKEN